MKRSFRSSRLTNNSFRSSCEQHPRARNNTLVGVVELPVRHLSVMPVRRIALFDDADIPVVVRRRVQPVLGRPPEARRHGDKPGLLETVGRAGGARAVRIVLVDRIVATVARPLLAEHLTRLVIRDRHR